MSLTPTQRYQQDMQQHSFIDDPAQAGVVEKLQALHDRLVVTPSEKIGLLGRLRNRRIAPVRGIYLWGGVGRGKTYLMDSFYESLPFQRKMRAHFHRFMKRVHRDLAATQGRKNPLDKVAAGIADEARVICFDEFYISDIADAMLLGTLMERLFSLGVTLVATSNIIPDELYKNGLQRAKFLPAIASIKQYCDVVHLDNDTDYRLQTMAGTELYHWPLNDQADVSMSRAFYNLVPKPEEVRKGVFIEVEGRDIPCLYIGEDVVWFDFKALCAGPRGQNDYIELAKEFHAVLVSSVPKMDGKRDDETRRFVNMIDEFYDRNVKVAITAEVSIEELYEDGRLNQEFERARSRLQEMQSSEYLARPHRP
jgi:cell division protein ZapE